MENQTKLILPSTSGNKQFNINDIKLIVGLGNIGNEYNQTRHNVGFDFLDFIGGTLKFNNESKLKSLLLSINLNKKKIILCKPTTMMNLSGESVSLVSKYYNIQPEEILVAHDDLDLRIENYKFQFAKGPKIHKGIISIENKLATNNFWRLRIGIDNRDVTNRKQSQGVDYVLDKFKRDELEMLKKMFLDINDMM